MASTQQFYRNDLTYNMVTDPKKLPLYRCGGTSTPYMCTGQRTWHYASHANFWGGMNEQGTRTWSSVANSYVAILNLSNLSNPVIMGTFVGRYPNATNTTKVRFTVDGTETVIAPSTTWNGRLVVGGMNFEGFGDTSYGQAAGGMRFLYYNTAADASTTHANGNGFVESPMDMLVHGMPVLYAEDSLKVEIWDSNVYASGYYYYCGVTWMTLEGF